MTAGEEGVGAAVVFDLLDTEKSKRTEFMAEGAVNEEPTPPPPPPLEGAGDAGGATYVSMVTREVARTERLPVRSVAKIL
jgi:hypothetical protein